MVTLDVHAHFDPRILPLDRLIEKLDSVGIDKCALIPAMNDPIPETPERLLSMVRRLLRSRAHPLARVMSDAMMTRRGDLRLGRRIIRIYRDPANEQVAAALAAHPQRLLGWIFLNPRSETPPLQTLERFLAVPGFVGVKLHPHWHGYRLEEALPIARECEARRLPVLVHLGFGGRGEYRILLDACPSLDLIFAHAGMPHYDRMWGALRDHDRAFVDVSSPYLDEALVRDAVAALGPRRVLYGTDAPYGFHGADGSYDYRVIRRWCESLPLPSRDTDRVLGGAAAELLLSR